MPLKPGAAEILARLRAQDAAIGLASSTRRELVECELKSVDLLRYFDQVVTGDQLEQSKPAPIFTCWPAGPGRGPGGGLGH